MISGLKLTKKNAFVLLLVTSLLILIANVNTLVAYAVSSKEVSVTLASNVTAKLYSAQIMTQNNAKLAAVTIEIANNSTQSLSLIDYWAKIKTKAGKTFQTKLKESDKAKENVLAKSTTYLTYYASVDSTIKYSDLVIDLIEWDFSAANYERRLGTLSTPNNSAGETSTNSTKSILYGDIPLKIGIKQSALYTDATFGHLTLNVMIENQGFTKNDLSRLRMFVQSDDNQVFTLDTTRVNAESISSKETKIVAVQANIPKAELNHKYTLIVAEWDETGKMNIPIGMFAMTKLVNTTATQPDMEKLTYIDGKAVNISVSNSSVSLVENSENLTTTVTLENAGNTKLTASNLAFYVKTMEGYLYPITKSEEGAITLLPKIKTTIEVSGQIPSESVLKTSEIIVMTTAENSADTFLANFVIKTDGTQESSGPEKMYNGIQIKQTSLNRIPYDLMDLIVAEFSLTNTTATAKSKINLQGYFKIDGVKLDSSAAKIVTLDELTTIGPNQTYNVLAYMEVPYNQITNKIEFVMQENLGQQNVKSIYQFSRNTLSEPINVTANKGYEITSLGKRSQVRFLQSNVYKGTTSDFFYAELEYTNKERRAIAPAQLAGYIENQDGSVINVELSEYKERIQPNGKIIISAWVQMPRGFEENRLKFYFGEAFTLSDDNASESAAKAVVRPVLANVVVKEIDVKSEFKDLSISNYLLNIRNIYVTVDLPDGITADGINLSFDYDLVKNDSVYPNAEDQKLLVEFIDHGSSKLTYTQEISLESKENESLTIGKDLKKTLKFNESGLFHKTVMKEATINIYKVFKGNKMLLATRDVKWYTRTP